MQNPFWLKYKKYKYNAESINRKGYPGKLYQSHNGTHTVAGSAKEHKLKH